MKTRNLTGLIIALLLMSSSIATARNEGGDQALAEGWRLFNLGSYQQAHENFRRAWETKALRESAGQGMVYSLMKQEKLDEALGVAEKFPPDHKVFGQIRRDIISQKSLAAFNGKNYPEAETGFRRLIELGATDPAMKTLLGWSLFHQGKEAEAAPVFVESYKATGDPKSAEAALLAFGRAGDIEGGIAFSAALAGAGDPELARMAGDFMYGKGSPITAAQADPAPQRPYVNADRPRIQAEAVYRTKTGDDGLSRLTDISLPITYSHPFETGSELSISIIPVSLDSGSAPAGPQAGSFYNKGSSREREVNTKMNGFVPRVTYRREGPVRYTARIGTTPISGEIDPAPTFLLKAQGGWFNVSARQEPVTESILSYTGMVDPYGTGSWGRVVRTGASAEFIFTFMGPHWFSIGGGYNVYSGEDVVDNSEFNATTSVGRAFSTESWDIAAGLFAYTARFDKNSNFFTWGHGGYFSPQEFMLGGAMLSMETRPVDDFWAEVKLSASYMNFVNEESSRYPLAADSTLDSQVYPGEEISQMGYAVSGRVYQQFAGHWLAGAGATFNKASDYTETIFMVTLRYQFGPRRAVLFGRE